MIIYVSGRRYRVVLVPEIINEDVGDADGECDSPDMPNKQIRIREDLEHRYQLEVFVHEFLHAAYWHISEESIKEVARDLSVFLWKLGYRLPTDWRERAGL